MNDVELKLKELILSRYGNLNRFCDVIGMPWTTLNSILKRGVEKANIANIIKITKELNLDTESLAEGKLVEKQSTLAAHFNGEEFTPEQIDAINAFAKYVKDKQ